MVVHTVRELSSNVGMSAYILLMGAETIAGMQGADTGFWEGFGGIERCRRVPAAMALLVCILSRDRRFFTWFMPICAAMMRSMRK